MIQLSFSLFYCAIHIFSVFLPSSPLPLYLLSWPPHSQFSGDLTFFSFLFRSVYVSLRWPNFLIPLFTSGSLLLATYASVALAASVYKDLPTPLPQPEGLPVTPPRMHRTDDGSLLRLEALESYSHLFIYFDKLCGRDWAIGIEVWIKITSVGPGDYGLWHLEDLG